MERCYNKKNKRYYCYGGRGITVCKHWHNVRNFIHDMEPTYKKGLQIERIDNDKGYSPNNCAWVTQTQQAQNKSSNINLTHKGQTFCLAVWSRKTGISYGTLWERVKILEWPAERALTTPALDAHARLKIARGFRNKNNYLPR